MNNSVVFGCPECKAIFEFDRVGEHELVTCPVCGSDFMTLRKGNKLALKSFEAQRNNLVEIMETIPVNCVKQAMLNLR